ncbi:MAG: nodulation protein NfeD [Candidatus Sumerlaeia bacterium]
MVSRLGLILMLMLVPAVARAAAVQPERHVNLINLDNCIISPVITNFIGEAIDTSEADGAVCLVIVLDTPGGLLESARDIVKRIMNANVPIVVYVAPSGSRAASAGVFITMAANIAAMAPSTHIGAAHPVTMGENEGPGRILPQDGKTTPTLGTSSQKVLNDTVAWIEGIARARGRNVAWARRAVIESVSIGNEEAVAQKVVDLTAAGTADLLAKIDGRTVQLHDKAVQLATAGARLDTLEMGWVRRALSVVVHPNVAYILMMLGILGLIFEFTHSGFGFSGIAGLICLVLAFYAFQVLPVSYAALGLIVIGIGLLIAEIKIVSHGLLAVGGMISLVLGSMLLFESPAPELRVSLTLILSIVMTVGAIVLFLVWRAVRAQAMPTKTGATGMVGEIGRAMTPLNPGGQVYVHGEIWSATSSAPVEEGASVRVLEVEGLRLTVEPVK